MATNHLQYSEYKARWKELSPNELKEIRDNLINKINALNPESASIKKSLTEILELLEEHMEEQKI